MEITPQFRDRLLAAVAREFRIRREILTLAAFASGHRRRRDHCRECAAPWPCPEVLRTAAPALEALADLSR